MKKGFTLGFQVFLRGRTARHPDLHAVLPFFDFHGGHTEAFAEPYALLRQHPCQEFVCPPGRGADLKLEN
jgi:hypothetical protein